MSLLEKLKSGKRNVRLIKFPGTDHDVALRVLSNAEVQEALFATEGRFKQKKIEVSATTVEAYEDENTIQILTRALRDPKDPEQPFAANVDQLREMITLEEKNDLVREYDAFENEVSPSAKTIDDDELDRIFDEVKKKPETGSSLNIYTLRKLIIYLASRQPN